MAKFETPFDDTKEIFQGVIESTQLDRVLDFDLVTNNKLTEVFKVAKTNDYEKHKTGVDVKIFINEEVFEKLDEIQKVIVAEAAMAHVSFDFDKDRLSISKPDVMGHSGIISKFGDKLYLNTLEIIKATFAQLKEEKAENGQEA
jgi:hypothetical protein